MSETYDTTNNSSDALDLKQHPGLLETNQVLGSTNDHRLVFTDYSNNSHHNTSSATSANDSDDHVTGANTRKLFFVYLYA